MFAAIPSFRHSPIIAVENMLRVKRVDPDPPDIHMAFLVTEPGSILKSLAAVFRDLHNCFNTIKHFIIIWVDLDPAEGDATRGAVALPSSDPSDVSRKNER